MISYNLVVYGSLLNPKEWEKQGISLEKIDYVKIKGFKRVFNQEPSWRKVDSKFRAVMNIEEDKNSWFNALIVKGLTKEDLADLDIRERGYDRTPISKENIENYDGIKIENAIVYKGKKEKQSDIIYPNKEYFNICLDGSKSHFKQFYTDYMETTFYYDNQQLKKIITF